MAYGAGAAAYLGLKTEPPNWPLLAAAGAGLADAGQSDTGLVNTGQSETGPTDPARPVRAS